MVQINETYQLNGTKKTPTVKFNKNNGILRIEGKSLPEYSYAFYGSVIDEIYTYLTNPNKTTELVFHLDYINTISSKLILQIILKFETLINSGKEVNVTWYYNEDDDMMIEMGEVYKSSTKIPVELVQI